MRNILIVLMLCALTLTASNVFAAKYDESKRTERFGLSFYDGRPMYYVYLGRPNGPMQSSYPVGDTYVNVKRLRTGDDITKLPHYSSTNTYVVISNGSTGYVDFIIYGYDDGGRLELVSERYDETANSWMREALARYGPGALAMARLGGGDLAVETYDRILPDAQDWAQRGILLAVALLVITTGLNKFRELTSGESQATAKDAKKVDGAASPKAEKPKPKKKIDTSEYLELEHESPYRLRTPRELREERARLDCENTERQQVMTEQEALREAYISGDYWGKSFSDEVRQSNRELYEAFDKMDPFTRRLLIQKFDEMSFTKEATLLKSYNKDLYGFADDNIGNPFEGGEDDEEDGEPPF